MSADQATLGTDHRQGTGRPSHLRNSANLNRLPGNPISPAQRVRRISIWLGALISALAFAWVGGLVLLGQLIEGHASASFMFGTACLIAGGALALFAVILTIGWGISSVFSDEAP